MVQNTNYFQELKSILDKFENASIEAIVLKGAALAAGIYPDLGLRPMKDLDLLVHKSQISDTTDIA